MIKLSEIHGMQSQAVMVVASASENPSGSWATGTKKYHILSKDFALVSTKKSNPKQLAGQPFAVLPWRGMEESAAQLGILPIPQGNGMGEALVRFFGLDVPTQQGATAAYKHHMTWENTPKTATYFLSYGGGRYEKARMLAEDTLDIEIKATGELSIDSALKGGELIDSNISEYGAESLADLATAKQLTGMGARLEFGEPGAGIRTAFEAMKLSLKRNITMSLPGKDGQHPSGSGSPRACSSKNSAAALTIDFIDTDGEELKRWREGVNTLPTATGQNDSAGLVKGRISIFGPAIASGINGEADYVNGGTLAATFGGTYSELGSTGLIKTTTLSVAGNAYLRSQSKVDGNVEVSGTCQRQDGSVVITGYLHERTPVSISPIPTRTVTVGTTDKVVNNDQQSTWTPGNYRDGIVRARGKLTLAAGTYNFRSLILEPGSTVAMNTASGPIYINVDGQLNFGDRTIQVINADPNKVFYYTNYSGVISIGTSNQIMAGVFTAPNATVTVSSGTTVKGVVCTKQLKLEADCILNCGL